MEHSTLVDLSHPFRPGMFSPAHLPGFRFAMLRRLGVAKTNVSEICIHSHMGTHIDAPRHFDNNGCGIEALSLDQLHGPATIWRFQKGAHQPISAHDLALASPPVEEGAIVLFSTGWGNKFQEPTYIDHPYLTSDAAEWLVEHQVKLVGFDTLTPDLPPPLRDAEFDFPVHRILLGAGVPIMENLTNLDVLIGTDAYLIAFPMNVEGGDGAPVRVVAFVHAPAGFFR